MDAALNVAIEGACRTRFAPSPTGPMHLGHVRTHLVAWLLARSRRGRIVMRIEDLDTPRVQAGAEASLLRDHAWLGLDWDEGPVRQSARTALYEQALTTLIERGAVYPCTCSRREIESVASAPHGDDGPVYPGTCRGGPTHPSRPAAMRFRMPDELPPWRDAILGASAPDLGRGDFVVRRADGLFAYQLAVVVDDHAQHVDLVVRGEDLQSSTPKQLSLFAALGYAPPVFAHVPLVRGHDGERLAKRNGARSVESYRASGVSPERMLGAAAWSLGLQPTARPTSLDELVASFSIDSLRAGASSPRSFVDAVDSDHAG